APWFGCDGRAGRRGSSRFRARFARIHTAIGIRKMSQLTQFMLSVLVRCQLWPYGSHSSYALTSLIRPILATALEASGAGDGRAHVGVGLDIPHVVVVHDAEPAFAEGVGQGERHLRLGEHDLGAVFVDEG